MMRMFNKRLNGHNAHRTMWIDTGFKAWNPIYNPQVSLGVTIWRRGAISFQVNGRFLQVVFGDWWKAGADRPSKLEAAIMAVFKERVENAVQQMQRNSPSRGSI